MGRIRGLWKLLFGRTTIFVVLILIQIAVLFGGVYLLDEKVIVLNYVVGVIAAVVIIYLLNIQQNSSFKLMWTIIIVATPIIGVPFYFFIKLQPGTRVIGERINEIIIEEERLLLPDKDTVNRLMTDSGQEYGLFKYLYEDGNYPVYDNSGAKYFPSGEAKYAELLDQLESATDFIFMEYFIIDKGEMWDSVLEILERKAREGVEVRLMYDGTCMMSLLPRNYPAKLQAMGIDCKIFSPMRPFLTTHQNNRDHRKIIVIDGRTGFTGGVNLADEYINRRERFGHWKDTAVMIQGEAVNNLTLMFLQMWNIDAKKKEQYYKYMYKPSRPSVGVKFGGYMAPFGDSPYDNEEVGKRVYLDIINRANEYVHITTPYLILDEEMTNALIFAAQRGIDVKIIVPHIPDKKYAYVLARTHYPELIRKGVKIYEYTPGFIHAKNFSCDDEKAVVGTINLDFRSLYLHFECAVYFWKNAIVHDVEDDFQETLKKCQRITLKNCQEYSLVGKICGKALRLVAPLM